MIVMVSWIHMDEYISKIAVSVIVVIVNYVFSKLFYIQEERRKHPSERLAEYGQVTAYGTR